MTKVDNSTENRKISSNNYWKKQFQEINCILSRHLNSNNGVMVEKKQMFTIYVVSTYIIGKDTQRPIYRRTIHYYIQIKLLLYLRGV